MNNHLALFLLSYATAFAQPAISPPGVGMVRDSFGWVQSVIGIAGNFLLADTGISNATSAAFSGSAGLIKTDSEVLVLDASYQVTARYGAPNGLALFAFDGTGAPALTYYSGTLFRFRHGNLEQVNWSGDAVAVAVAGRNAASILVRRDDRLWNVRLSLAGGEVENEVLLAGVSGPAALLPDGVLVYFDGNDVVVRDGLGAERRVAAGFVVGSFEQLGKDWLAIREVDTGRLFALRVRPEGLDLYQVPDVEQ